MHLHIHYYHPEFTAGKISHGRGVRYGNLARSGHKLELVTTKKDVKSKDLFCLFFGWSVYSSVFSFVSWPDWVVLRKPAWNYVTITGMTTYDASIQCCCWLKAFITIMCKHGWLHAQRDHYGCRIMLIELPVYSLHSQIPQSQEQPL